MSSETEMSDVQFTNVFSIMIGGMILLTIALIILANLIVGDGSQSDISAQVHDGKVAERISPEGQINIGALATTNAVSNATETASGTEVYNSSCVACHGTGIAGAPVLGDVDAWTQRLSQGIEVLYEHAIQGFQGSAGIMPPKGGNASLSDDAVKAAVDYMLEGTQ